jgi:hypothetical protein
VFGSTTLDTDGTVPASTRRPCASAGDFETDAALLWYRESRSEPTKQLAVVDGSLVRTRDGRYLLSACRETDA